MIDKAAHAPPAPAPAPATEQPPHAASSDSLPRAPPRPRWSFGVMEDPLTQEVPGSVLLLSDASRHNAPLGMRNMPRRSSASSLPSAYEQSQAMFGHHTVDKKRTPDGKIILEPQPEDSVNDPLNWASWRRDVALISLGLYCMVGGGMTSILAAGFTNIARTYDVTISQVALTTGLYMLGLGIGGVVWSPTAIKFGKRPIYLFTSVLFILSAIWCGLSDSYASLVVARIFQGIAVAPVECLPSATIAEIFFLHERAYRLGIYTLLLLGGKNLSPLASAAIIQRWDWEYVFYILAGVVCFCGLLLFLFVPETFWDRTPRASEPHENVLAAALRRYSSSHGIFRDFGADRHRRKTTDEPVPDEKEEQRSDAIKKPRKKAHFEGPESLEDEADRESSTPAPETPAHEPSLAAPMQPTESLPSTTAPTPARDGAPDTESQTWAGRADFGKQYTQNLREAPAKTFLRTLKPWDGRFSNDNWFAVALRPFVLFAYPSILWSAAVYACAVGWLIVLSESAAEIYRSPARYNFSALGVGLVYISPFVGGVLGTAVAGKLSDVIVKAMAQRNGGIYEPEFRLVMAVPVAISTTVGLMGYGWSVEAGDAWIVPTVFFGVISFGCSLASTTSITFAVDSYRQYAGEALVTLNFCKNVLHGFVFSLFINTWLEADGPRTVFLALGGIQLGLLLFTIPVYVFGKRLRMWTVRRNLMEKF